MDTGLVTLPCKADRLVDLRLQLRPWLTSFDLAYRGYVIVLATHEAAANAVEHADPSNALNIRASITQDRLTIDAIDSGRLGRSQQRPAERVHGLTLIRALIEHIEIQPGPHGTTMRMRQPI